MTTFVLLSVLALAQQPQSPHANLGGLPCTACHVTSGWRDVAFDHRRTRLPLRGRHLTAPCSGCHDLRDFRGAERSCASCHADPHQGDAGRDCTDCHQETTWRAVNPQDAHARSRLPDLGSHTALRCQDCHAQVAAQQFHSPVRPCVSCHQATYNATANPPHQSIAIPPGCNQCHQLTTWRFALFPQHDAVFGIYAGEHAGVWRACSSCHPSAADFSQFTCTNCHTQGPTGNEHQGIPGYQWESTACLGCHPRGGQGDLSFHEAVFPIFSPAHGGVWSTCTQCHVNPADRGVVSCLDGGCHTQAATDPPHASIPGYGWTTPQCRSCHPDGRGGTFAQHDAVFPIYSGTHNNRWASCATCHTVPGDRSIFTCTGAGCHSQAEMNNHHQEVPGYNPAPAGCLSCHPDGTKP